ncbi:MAG: hypothetical protein ACYDC6_14850 [Acidobacteriaceae bacterium]
MRSHAARDLADFLTELGQHELRTEGSGRQQGILSIAAASVHFPYTTIYRE